ncbi:MAG: hypothetical protein IPK98_06910 [Chloracidobacterium sp.]|nr:hypothetical protein [Chloracidobacterium sp.]
MRRFCSLPTNLTGHIYEMLVLVPNWKSGEVADVVRYVDFIRIGMPSHFFSIAQFGCLLLSLVTFVAVSLSQRKGSYVCRHYRFSSVIVNGGNLYHLPC